MQEIFEYLESYQDAVPKVLKLRIQNVYDLSENAAEEIYRKWKKVYFKTKF